MRSVLKKMKHVLFMLLCLAVGLVTGLFLAKRLVNLYAPQTAPLPVKGPVEDDSLVLVYR